MERRWTISHSPTIGPHVFSVSNQRNGAGGSIRQDRKLGERGKKKEQRRKTGYNFPRVINIKSQVLHSFSLKPVFPLAPGQRLLTLFSFFLTSLRRCSLVTFQAMNTCLWRMITYRALQRKITQSTWAIFHSVINVSGAVVHPARWPPTLGMCDSPGEEKGGLGSYLSCSVTELQVDPEESSSSDVSNTTTCTERVRGREC